MRLRYELRVIRHRNDFLFIKINFYNLLTWLNFPSLPAFEFLALWTLPYSLLLSSHVFAFFSSSHWQHYFPFFRLFVCLFLPPFPISRCVLKVFFLDHVFLVNFSSLPPAEETFLESTERRRKRKFPRANRKDSENTSHRNPRIFSLVWKCFLLEPTPPKICVHFFFRYLKTSENLPYCF